MKLKIVALMASVLIIAGCDALSTEFADTPRLEELKTLAATDPDPDWDLDLLEAYPEANLMVHVELCGKNGSALHDAAMTRYETITEDAERDRWLNEYVTTIIMIELQLRYNLVSGSISSRGAVCARVNERVDTWRENGELPTRLL